MARPSHREKLLSEGLRVVHERGFSGASVRDIVTAAGVPQGSFTNHFASKEEFGIEVLDLYFAGSREVIAKTLLNENLPPLVRLRSYIDIQVERNSGDTMRNGCLLGNFGAEAIDHSERIRVRLVKIFEEVKTSVLKCLDAVSRAGQLRTDMPLPELAIFIVSSLQGAILLAKTERTPPALQSFRNFMFSTLLG